MNRYNKTEWKNGQAPALNAENLNKIENGIETVTNEVINSVQNVQLRGSAPYPNVDSAIENNVVYRVFTEGSGSPCGWLWFCGSKNYVGAEVAQIRLDRSGILYTRKGTANNGIVTWTGTWVAFEPGKKGDKGDQGNPGADGFSPTATVTKSGHTATITITDKNGTTTAEISDGEGGGDVSNKMDLAPLNPTVEQIAALSAGQLYGDTVNHKGIVKGGQEFYDSVYIENNYRRAFKSSDFGNNAYYPPYNIPSDILARFLVGDSYAVTGANGRAFSLVRVEQGVSITGSNYIWQPQYLWLRQIYGSGDLPNQVALAYRQMPDGSYYYETQSYFEGDMLYYKKSGSSTIDELYICVGVSYTKTLSPVSIIANYIWQEIPVPKNYYTKTEINTMIGDIGTALDTLNNNLAEV